MKTLSTLLLTAALLVIGSFQGLLAQGFSYFAGSGAGQLTYPNSGYDCFVGFNAGYLNTSGSFNSFVGSFAGYSNTTGVENSFLGSETGYSNTTGRSNSFVGTAAGTFSTTGSYNSFMGSFAGFKNITGGYNSFIGSYAGYSNTTGFQNTFVGNQAGFTNTTGRDNAFFGHYAGYSNTGDLNTFIGNQAGYKNTSGKENTFLGRNAGYNNTTGSLNLFLGAYAGQANTSGANNSFIGPFAGFKTTTGYDNAFLGTKAGYENTTGYYNFYLGKQAGFNNKTGANNAYLGNGAGYYNVGGSANVCIGTFSGYNNIGSSNIFLGYNTNSPSGVTLTNAVAIGSKAYVSASNSLVLGSINGTNGATVSTKVGIGTTAPAYLLHVNGTAAKPGGGSWTVASDRRLKKDIASFADGLEVLTQIKPVWFRYNGEAGLPTEKKYVGVIAQDMQKIAPYTVGQFTYSDTTGKQTQYLDYDANALIYILVNSVKEQQQQIVQRDEKLETVLAQNAALQNKLNSLENELAQIKALLKHNLPVEATSNAQLFQNEPNPFDQSTVIRYFIPENASSALIKFYSGTGQEVHSVELSPNGNGQITLSHQRFASGTYVYQLFVDGQPIASRKLVLNR
jgi:trimeric autotransporter adhesin